MPHSNVQMGQLQGVHVNHGTEKISPLKQTGMSGIEMNDQGTNLYGDGAIRTFPWGLYIGYNGMGTPTMLNDEVIETTSTPYEYKALYDGNYEINGHVETYLAYGANDLKIQMVLQIDDGSGWSFGSIFSEHKSEDNRIVLSPINLKLDAGTIFRLVYRKIAGGFGICKATNDGQLVVKCRPYTLPFDPMPTIPSP